MQRVSRSRFSELNVYEKKRSLFTYLLDVEYSIDIDIGQPHYWILSHSSSKSEVAKLNILKKWLFLLFAISLIIINQYIQNQHKQKINK